MHDTASPAPRLPLRRRLLLAGLLTLFTLGFLEALLHVCTRLGLLPVIPLITPWYYTANTAAYGFDEHGAPVFTGGTKSVAERGMPPVPAVYDDDGLRPVDAARLGAAGRKVAFFGDSYTEGLQVPDEATFPRRVEAGLRQAGQETVCLNFGVGGTGTHQQLLRYRTLRARAKLDTVVLCLLPNNDILNNHAGLGGGIELPGSAYLTLENGVFTERPPKREILPRISLLRHTVGRFFLTRMAYYGRDLARQLRNQAADSGSVWTPGMGGQGDGGVWTGGKRNLLDVYRAAPDPQWENAWAVTEESLRRFARETREAGGELVVVLVAGILQVEFNAGPGNGWAEGLDFGLPNRRLVEFCRREGIRCLDSLPFFVQRKGGPETPALFWQYDSHYTAAGHQVMADFLLSQGLTGEAAAPAARRD